MKKEHFNKATKGKSYQILESHDLTYVYGDINIFRDSQGQLYIGIEVQPDRGMPFFDYWTIKEEYYQAFKTPNIDALKKLLSIRFFEATLFEVFLQKKGNMKVISQILEEPKLPKIENSSVRSWFVKQQKINADVKLFKNPIEIGQFEMPDLVHASQFKSDNILELDLLFKSPEKDIYELQKCYLNIKDKEIVEGDIIDMNNGLPFFTFAKDYPIKPVVFGDKLQFEAKVLDQETYENPKRLVIMKGIKKLYEYQYPKEANLGRFWVFDDNATIKNFKNSVLFMYSMRSHDSEDDYYVLRFEVEKEKVIPKTRVSIKGDSVVSFSPNGRMVYSSTKKGGRRSKQIKVVRL